jgi:hypothetical protein
MHVVFLFNCFRREDVNSDPQFVTVMRFKLSVTVIIILLSPVISNEPYLEFLF